MGFINKVLRRIKDNSQVKEPFMKISKRLGENERYIKQVFQDWTDIVIREINIGNNPEYPAVIVYIDGMLDQQTIELGIMTRLIHAYENNYYEPGTANYVKFTLGVSNKDIYTNMNDIIDSILRGLTVIFIDGESSAVVFAVAQPPARGIEEPQAETVLRGPREGFSETIRVNSVLLRKRIRSVNFKIEYMEVGRKTRTDIFLCYVKGLANDKVVEEVRRRIGRIGIDEILDASYIVEYIEDEPFGVFPTILRTEKPDVAAGFLVEGRVAVLIDGTPVALLLPALFFDYLITSEDYSFNFIPATLNRWLRYSCFFITLFLPGLYVAIITYHQEIIPPSMVVTIIKTRSGVPFTPFWGAVLMLFGFEIIREAGVRMSKAAGQAVSIVGALVIGQSAVEAGIVGAPMVIVIALSAIASFAVPVPEMQMALTLPRFIFLVLAGNFGMIGLLSGFLIFFMKIVSLRSFGAPYFAPLEPLIDTGLEDTVIRAPLWSMKRRPWYISWKKSIRRNPKGRVSQIKEEHKKRKKRRNKS